MKFRNFFTAGPLFFTLMVISYPAFAELEGDTDKDGKLSSDEFVILLGERDLKSRDQDGDGRLSLSEWNGKSKSQYRQSAFEKFNANKDAYMDVPEIIDVYLWTFSNRDKNDDGILAGDEIPKHLRNK